MTRSQTQIKFTNGILPKLKPLSEKGTWYCDTEFKNLRLWVGKSGKKSWYIQYRKPDGQQNFKKLGNVEIMTVQDARDAAREFTVQIKRGEKPWEKPQIQKKQSLEMFLQEVYAPWVVSNRRTGEATLAMIRSSFPELLNLPLDEININMLDEWTIRMRQDKGLKGSSINRKVTTLKSLLNWAVKHGYIESHGLGHLERAKEDDSATKTRYLLPEERIRLYTAMDTREEQMRAERDRYNLWCKERNKPLLPDLRKCIFADHLKPMVIVSLNTGIRQGSLFQLLWDDINFVEKILTIRPSIDKTTKLVKIPMNQEVMFALEGWRKQTEGTKDNLVFPSPKTGEVMDNCRHAWASLLKLAEISNFRWHDMRHDFGSQLAMQGKGPHLIMELMGHSDIKMTLRYMHLAPNMKHEAVESLGLLPKSNTLPANPQL